MQKKSVVITGGSKGIGLGITRVFAESGYRVVVGAREDVQIQNLVDGDILFHSCDVTNERSHSELIELAQSDDFTLTCYINNVGKSAWKPIEEFDDVFLQGMIEVNLKSAFWGCKHAAKNLSAEGSIINISSLAGKRGSLNNSSYCAAKFGMNGMTQSLAKELGPRGIRVNALCPVLIESPGLNAALLDADSPANGSEASDFIASFARQNSALGRLPSAEDVGSFAHFLASDAARSITGQCINIDCGVLPQ